MGESAGTRTGNKRAAIMGLRVVNPVLFHGGAPFQPVAV